MQASTDTASGSAKGRRDVDLAPVRAAVEPILVSHGFVLVDLQWLTDSPDGNASLTLRVTIEREGSEDVGGGVNLDDCAEVSRDISKLLDVEDLVSARYALEVSSPGLDRPLKALRDFRRFEGKLAKVKLARPAPDGQWVLRGPLVSPSQTSPSRETDVAVMVDGRVIEVPHADVSVAHLVFELETQAKPGRPKGKQGQKAKPPQNSKPTEQPKPAKRTTSSAGRSK